MIQIHRIHCQDPWFSLIRQGLKPVEGRKGLPKYSNWNAGDKLIFFLGNNEFETIITGINRYESIQDYLNGEGIERALPGVQTVEEAIRIYLQWNTLAEVEKYGFLGIQVKVASLD